MSDQGDRFPDNITASDFLEPQPATVAAFGQVCASIDAICEVDQIIADPLTGEVPDLRNLYLTRKRFNNGSTISAQSMEGNEEYLRMLGGLEPVRTIQLVTAEEIRYEYSGYQDGRSKLFTKKPGTRVGPKADSSDSVELDTGSGLSIELRGTPEIIRHIKGAVNDRFVADKLGVTKPTDGSLSENLLRRFKRH